MTKPIESGTLRLSPQSSLFRRGWFRSLAGKAGPESGTNTESGARLHSCGFASRECSFDTEARFTTVPASLAVTCAITKVTHPDGVAGVSNAS